MFICARLSTWKTPTLSPRCSIRHTAGSSRGMSARSAIGNPRRLQQRKTLADAGEHAQRQHIDLHDAERVDVVLVPFDEDAVGHGGGADRHRLDQPAARQHEAADMLRQVARKADQLARQRDGAAQQRIGGVEADLAQPVIGPKFVAGGPALRRQRRRRVLRQSHHLADFADRHFRAVVDHGRGDRGAVAAVAVVDVLDDFLAPLVLEIDVDVGRLAPFGGDEALEQQVDLGRIDGGDAEAVAHGGIRRRAAALAENLLLPREAHDVVDGEEIARVAELRDQREFLRDRGAHLVGHAGGIALRRALPGQRGQMRVRRGARRHRLVGIFVGQIIEREAAALPRSRACARARRDGRGTAAPSRRAISGAARRSPAARSRPASTVVPSRIAVITSCSGRRSGA